jgi:hypothetical protein
MGVLPGVWVIRGGIRSTAVAAMKVSERQATGRDEIALHAINSEVRARIEQIDEASRVERAERDAQLDRKIAELAAKLRNRRND